MPPKARVPFRPPDSWKRLYDRLTDYRKEIQAPVDTIGCHCLYDRQASPQLKRFHILVALMLSSQTKDEVTAAAMKGLLAAGLSPQSVKQMPAAQLDAHISKVGFHNKKTEYIKEVSRILLDNYDGQVPTSYADIIALPGVGPKMAHLFLQAADHQVLGIGVDTHVHRISQRFNWVDKGVKTPEDTRKCLESWMPRELWEDVNVLLVGLGQTVCTPVHPKCGQCKLNTVCPNAFKEDKKGKSPRRSPVRDIEDVVEKPRKRARR